MKGKSDYKTSPWPVPAWAVFARYPVTAFKTLQNSADWMEQPRMGEMGEVSPALASGPN